MYSVLDVTGLWLSVSICIKGNVPVCAFNGSTTSKMMSNDTIRGIFENP